MKNQAQVQLCVVGSTDGRGNNGTTFSSFISLFGSRIQRYFCIPSALQFTTGPELTAPAGYIVNVNETHGGSGGGDDDEKEALMSPKAATAAAPAPANGTAAGALH